MASASEPVSSEIIIVGAGLAGTTLAAVLGKQGRRVMVVDPHPSCPPVFKAEKIEKEQVRLLRKFGLLDRLVPYAGRVSEVHGAYDGRIFRSGGIEQYGLKFADMVEAVRGQTPPTAAYRVGYVEAVANSGDVQRVRLRGGEELTARLVVLASGVSADGIQTNFKLRRRVVQKDQSLGIGFDLATSESRDFDFDAITYYSVDPVTRIDYLTLFKFREVMRANLFVFRSASDPWVREFIEAPERMLRSQLPKLNRLIGEYRVTGKVESGRVDLYRMEVDPQPGVVMIGDAWQTSCPATGMGIDKVLTDVDILSECVPGWFVTPGMSAQKLAEFYEHPRKRATDSTALQRAQDHRRLSVDTSLRWRVHRSLLHLKWQLLGSSASLRKAMPFAAKRQSAKARSIRPQLADSQQIHARCEKEQMSCSSVDPQEERTTTGVTN